MIIERIEIKSFGQLSDMSLEFSDKINIIEGQNEAGKSTIAAFIKYMLYGFEATEGPYELSERSKRINWSTGVAEGAMTVSVAGKRYHITRSTVRVENAGRISYKEDSTIIDLESETPAFGKLPAGEVFFGVDRELFENTAFVGQVGNASISEGSVKQAIENILFSGNEKINIQRAASKITEKMETLVHKGNTGGVIIDLVKKQDELSETLRSTDDDNKKILAKEAELHEIKMRRQEAETKRARLLDFETCYRNVELIQNFDNLHILEEQLEKKNEEYNEFIYKNTKNGFVPTNDYLTDIALAKRSVDDTYRRMEDSQRNYAKERSAIGITKEIEGAIQLSDTYGGEDKLRDLVSLHSTNKLKFLFGTIIAVLAAIAAAVAIAVTPPLAAIKAVFITLTALSFLCAGYLVYRYIGVKKREDKLCSEFGTVNSTELKAKLTVIAAARSKRDTLISNTENARLAHESVKLEHEAARKELVKTVALWSDEHSSQDASYITKLEERVREFLAEKKKLADEKNNAEIAVKELRRRLADKSEIDIRGLVSPIKRKVVTELKHEDLIHGIEQETKIIEEQQRLSFSVENELAELKLRATDPGELYSKIQALDTKVSELSAKHKAYFYALDAINNASDNLRHEISPRLGEVSTELLEIMTNNKYSLLDIDSGLKISFEAPDGQTRSVDYLSGGTRDLTYIAVRMALIDMLYTELPPICFDETFANQDNARATSMMRAIKKLSDDGHQSFIFTCRQREANIASELQPRSAIFKLSVAG